MLNGNEVFDCNGWCEIFMPPYSARVLVVNDGSFRLDEEAPAAAAPVKKAKNHSKKELKEEAVTLGRYRHFKGNEYEVIGFAKHSETEEKLVLYRSTQNPEEVWARPYDMFKEIITRDGKQVRRFTKLDN